MDWVSATVPVAGAAGGRFANERVLTGTEAHAPHALPAVAAAVWPLYSTGSECGRPASAESRLAVHRDKVRSTSECGTNCLLQINVPPRAIEKNSSPPPRSPISAPGLLIWVWSCVRPPPSSPRSSPLFLSVRQRLSAAFLRVAGLSFPCFRQSIRPASRSPDGFEPFR